MGLFNRQKKQSYSIRATVTLPESIDPEDREERYERRLAEFLAREHRGEITGGGSALSPTGEIEYVDIELLLADADETPQRVARGLERVGAPRGSILRVGDGPTGSLLTFGSWDRFSVYLDGVSLPPSVYQSANVDDVADEIYERLKACGDGQIRGSWAGPTETAIYIWAQDVEGVASALSSVLTSHPLCQNARVVVGGSNSREFRVPQALA